MKNFVVILMLISVISLANAQTRKGLIFSEHEAIETTKAVWEAFANSDTEKFLSYFADSVYVSNNGNRNTFEKNRLGGWIKWWSNVEDLKIEDDKPATPNAFEYENAAIRVQDWLRFTGTHEKSGINIDLPWHNMYDFDKNGKIKSIHLYYNPNTYNEITNSLATQENGKVYINHPYIVLVRKALNAAYLNKDVNKWAEFYTPDAEFGSSTMKWNQSMDLETKKEQLKEMLLTMDIKLRQIGYPDCVYYAKGNSYVVYSWWNITEKEGDKEIEYPVMFSHNFNDEGKIIMDYMFYSSNHRLAIE